MTTPTTREVIERLCELYDYGTPGPTAPTDSRRCGRPDGRTYDSHQAYRYRLKDGLIVEGETIPVDQQAFAEFLA